MQEFMGNVTLANVIYFLFGIIVLLKVIPEGLKRIDRYMDHIEHKENKDLIEKFDHMHAVLTFHMDAAYETIHKDNILVYSLDGVKPREEDIDLLSKEFVKLTMKLCGPNIFELMMDLYGDEETLFFVMMDYFSRRFEDDEIRASAIDNIQEGNEDI
jgi:hypothetical protein